MLEVVLGVVRVLQVLLSPPPAAAALLLRRRRLAYNVDRSPR